MHPVESARTSKMNEAPVSAHRAQCQFAEIASPRILLPGTNLRASTGRARQTGQIETGSRPPALLHFQTVAGRPGSAGFRDARIGSSRDQTAYAAGVGRSA